MTEKSKVEIVISPAELGIIANGIPFVACRTLDDGSTVEVTLRFQPNDDYVTKVDVKLSVTLQIVEG